MLSICTRLASSLVRARDTINLVLLFQNVAAHLQKILIRCEQDLNLRGETPLDFESNALTARPSQHFLSRRRYNNNYYRSASLVGKSNKSKIITRNGKRSKPLFPTFYNWN